jgi:hypothetical protein
MSPPPKNRRRIPRGSGTAHAKLHQEVIDRGGQTGPDHIQEAAELLGCGLLSDNYVNALVGNY